MYATLMLTDMYAGKHTHKKGGDGGFDHTTITAIFIFFGDISCRHCWISMPPSQSVLEFLFVFKMTKLLPYSNERYWVVSMCFHCFSPLFCSIVENALQLHRMGIMCFLK